MGWGGSAASHFRGTQAQWPGINGVQPLGTVIYRSTGVKKNNFVTGVTRDSTGAAVGSCSLDLYMTGVDMLAQQTVSNASGNFTFSNPGSGPFYIVAYKVGAPDLAGTTVNTLIAA